MRAGLDRGRPRRRLARLFGLVAAIATLGTAGLAGELRPFDAASLAAIRQTYAGQPFVLAFWSIHCAPCKEDMDVFAAMHRKFPEVPIVLVSTDPRGNEKAVGAFLSRYPLGRIATWIFADDFVEKVRYSVDRTWRGELPRTYFYDSAHASVAHSGLLDAAWVEAWFARERETLRRKRK